MKSLDHMDAQFFKEPPYCSMGFPGGSDSKESTCNVEDLGLEDPLKDGMATYSSILAWRIIPMGLQRVGHDRVTKHSTVQISTQKMLSIISY